MYRRPFPKKINLLAIRDGLASCLYGIRIKDLEIANAYAVEALARVDKLLPSIDDINEISRKARVAGKLGGTMKQKNKLKALTPRPRRGAGGNDGGDTRKHSANN